MPILATCHRIRRQVPAGFSLLELLVVLALMSFVTALVAPSLKKTVDAITRSGDRAEARRQLERLPLLARNDGAAIRIASGQPLSAPGFSLPTGWSMRSLTNLDIRANGYCFAATVEVTTPDGAQRWRINSPDCRVSDVL